MKAVIFDAYGTLLDVHSAMARHAPQLGPAWQEISQTWRTKQIEYTWTRTLAGQHRDFARLTREALVFAAAKHGIDDPALLDQVEQSYRALTAYPDAVATLTRVRAIGLPCAILSNGETAMLAEGVRSAGLDDMLDAVLSIDPVSVFKPDQRVYALATERFGATPGEIAFLSSNAWDAFGARQFGLRVFWVNRLKQPDEYDLSSTVTVIDTLARLPDLLA